MSLIVASRFTMFNDAEAAMDKLHNNGFVDEDVSLFYVNPGGQHAGGQHARFPVGGDRFTDPQSRWASLGAGAGAAAGALVGVIVAIVLSLLFLRSLLVLAVAAGVGAYVGTLAGALWQTRGGGRGRRPDIGHDPGGTPAARESGVLVAVHVSPGTQQQAAQVLGAAGGQQIERANGRWQHGHWSDFDPTHTVEPLQR
ncbi:hypothetical protein F4827_001646 [Paraburkholderia bannensis]|uniref:Glycine zipper family protein n=1 Tax=Paraburkholderia bannensis TaxID=765414 RepID=A0A7W9TUQ8_9BURK|nr:MULTISPECIES: hypothetical protein [Paraburkholderia]MBB3256800.1 hypothetical protein [Paraburkholderia sp. WP4_3_2]MBB6101798.1 hypothetical protein [Paraburkholderia bannensis]